MGQQLQRWRSRNGISVETGIQKPSRCPRTKPQLLSTSFLVSHKSNVHDVPGSLRLAVRNSERRIDQPTQILARIHANPMCLEPLSHASQAHSRLHFAESSHRENIRTQPELPSFVIELMIRRNLKRAEPQSLLETPIGLRVTTFGRTKSYPSLDGPRVHLPGPPKPAAPHRHLGGHQAGGQSSLHQRESAQPRRVIFLSC